VATAVFQQLKVPSRVRNIIEGESLFKTLLHF
jgi:NhaP-type Na+/H+ or K+/H+ antiporter